MSYLFAFDNAKVRLYFGLYKIKVDNSEIYSVRIHPPCQFDEIGDRKLLGTLREEGMFRPSEIAESRPQGVAQHLAALAERGLDHADEQPFVAVEPVHSVAAQT